MRNTVHFPSLLTLLALTAGVTAAACDPDTADTEHIGDTEIFVDTDDTADTDPTGDTGEALGEDDELEFSEAEAPGLAPRDGSGEFVGTRGAEFYLGGKPFRHVGANIALVYMPMWQVERELDFLRDAGVKHVRVNLPNDQMSTPQMIARLKRVVDAAYYGGAPRRWIRVTVVLGGNYGTDLWHWDKCIDVNSNQVPGCDAPRSAIGRDARSNPWNPGDRGFYTRPVPDTDLTMLNDAYLDWGHTAYYKPHAIAVVSAFKDHPGIFSWDITNEVNSSGSPAMVALLVNFYRSMAKTLRDHDPNHLITTGMISTSWADMNDAQRDAVYQDPNIDYLTVHSYDGPNAYGKIEYENGNDQHDDIWRANRRYFKPVIVEEFGMSGANAFERVRTYFQKHFAGPNLDLQVDAIVPFGVTSNETGVDWGTGDTPASPRSQGMIRPYQALWGRWTAQLDPRLPLIVDNDPGANNPARAKFEASGAWSSSHYSGERWGANYHTTPTNNGATGEDGASFSFKLDAPACKTIDARWNANSSRSNTVPFVIYDGNNQHLGTAYKNQQIEGDRWVPIGSWCFSAGWNRVTLSRWSPAPGHIIADAIRVR